ncbi:alpha/beta hydrolase family protein [Sphingomonas hengshuiensis]|nr:prolyl oligopeptidase family serine peptidase [Sphingomonas hengshuiensis]
MRRTFRGEFITTGMALAIAAAAWAASPLAVAQSVPGSTGQSVAPTPLPISAISRYEQMTAATISPDGKHLAALVATDKYKWPVIAIYATDDLSKPPVWIPSETLRIVGVGFYGNDRISFVVEAPVINPSGRPTITRKLAFSDLDGKNVIDGSGAAGSRNKGARENQERYGGMGSKTFVRDLYNPDLVLIERSGDAQSIVELNLKTKESRLVAEAGARSVFLAGGVDLATGEPRIKLQLDLQGDSLHARMYIRDAKTRAWVRHDPLSYAFKDRHRIEVAGYGSSPNELLVLTNRGRDNVAVYSYDIANQKMSAEPLYQAAGFDVAGVSFRLDREKKVTEVSGIAVEGPATTQVIFDPAWAEAQQKIRARFPGKNVTLELNRESRTMAVVRVDAPDLPPEYYFYRNGALALLGKQRPWIDPATLGHAEFITYTARDGLRIPAFVTYPAGWTPAKGPVPLVVMPHGGPWARDELSWDPAGWVQFLATRGVAVIQPQYRGSDGWGHRLWTAGDREWGQKMQDDKDDGAAYLVAKGVADPKRMAIFGYSYGGFAAIAASVRPNSPYRCAIAGAGVASIERIGNLWGAGPIQQEVQGWTVRGMDPMKNVAKANIPIMLYHGDHDRQADTEHSRMFYRAMKSAGKKVEYHEIPGMWHTLPWHTEWHEQTLTLIEKYLKSDNCKIL